VWSSHLDLATRIDWLRNAVARFLRKRLSRLRSQLIFIFLVGFPGIALAIGLPVIALISQQSSSHAQRLLDQAVVASQAFIEREQSDLQSLALLISQRPTLRQLLEQQNFVALESYLDTLRASVNLDLILICADETEIAGVETNPVSSQLCRMDARAGYAALPPGNTLYLYATADTLSDSQSPYKVIIGKHTSLILTELQKETGLLYFLIWQDQAVHSGELSLEVTPPLTAELQAASQSTDRSLRQRSFNIDDQQYILSSLEMDPSLQLRLVSGLNVDDQIAVQRNLSTTLLIGLLLIVLIASALGIWLSQRISQPIVHLANAAAEFRQGNLDSPIAIQSTAWEINQLSNTLEDGRIALQHSLQQLQAEKAWMEHLLHSIVEGMLTLDTQNRITFASAGISKITGDEPDQIIGQRIDDVFLPLDGEVEFSRQLPAVGQQRRISVRLKNGQERLLSISKSKLVPPEASNSNRALVVRDVSNEEYIHRLLGDFMANITHEFRTPLAALEASSELLLDNLHSLSRAETEELLIALNLGIINLQTLIDNLIEAASIEAGRFKVSIQPVSFEGILREALNMVQPLAEKYSLQLISQSVERPIIVMADQRRTVQALVNLLSNAVKHSPENGSIQIKHHVVDKKLLRVEVIDEGSGIPIGQQSNLFRRFAHLDTENERARQGAGLGLSVVKEIVEAQQGEVGITARTEGGTTFWFTLPLANGRGQT
ncbi:MAG TPA: ATP-binding protein, partial [Anaerolineales bacterium]|nr:ATP-binding protein [Anaerolineales bacterium]